MPEKCTPGLLPPALLESLKLQSHPTKQFSIHSSKRFGLIRLVVLGALVHTQDPWADKRIDYTGFTLRVEGATSPVAISSQGEEPMLNISMKRFDLACMYELIRLNHPIDTKDHEGITPLLWACGAVAQATRCRLPISEAAVLMVKTLVLHHADVNIAVDDMTPLFFMAFAGKWDLCKLLLEHGAKPCTPYTSRNLTSECRIRLDFMVKLHANSGARPQRLCPCHSGLALDSCHNTPDARQGNVLWPSYATCPCCAGNKPYSNCCLKRGTKFAMYWRKDRLVHDKHLSPLVTENFRDALSPEAFKRFNEDQVLLGNTNELESTLPSEEQAARLVNIVVNNLCREGRLDPAFTFVVRKFGYYVRPLGRDIPKVKKEANYRRWNCYAEEYIQSGVDSRSRKDIEIVSKCGIDGGPMYRLCESDACAKREGLENEYKRCSKCKVTVYCSKECQKTAWKGHKNMCCSRTRTGQWLPDSRLLFKKLIEPLEFLTSEDGVLPQPPDPARTAHILAALESWLETRGGSNPPLSLSKPL